MKFLVNDKLVLELNETQLKVIQEISETARFPSDLERRVKWVIERKYIECFDRFKKTWEKKLAEAGVESIPTDKDKFAQLVFDHPLYKKEKSLKIVSNDSK